MYLDGWINQAGMKEEELVPFFLPFTRFLIAIAFEMYKQCKQILMEGSSVLPPFSMKNMQPGSKTKRYSDIKIVSSHEKTQTDGMVQGRN